MNHFAQLNLFIYTWHISQQISPKMLVKFSFRMASSTSQHPKDSLAQWYKEVMAISVIDTAIFRPRSTTVASNSAFYELGITLQGILKKVKGQILIHFYIILEKSRTRLTWMTSISEELIGTVVILKGIGRV